MNNKICLTFLDTHGAIAAAIFLNKHPDCELIVSSSGKFQDTFKEFIERKNLVIYIIGLGPAQKDDETIDILKKVLKNNKIKWITHIDHKNIFKRLADNKNFSFIINEEDHLAKTVKKEIKNNSSRAKRLADSPERPSDYKHYDDLVNKAKFWFFNFGDKEFYPSIIKELSYESYKPKNSEESYDGYNDQKYLLGKNDIIRQLREKIKIVGMDSICNVLITGESGTGKTTIAYALHKVSNRKSRPFVSVSCANFSENLLESELFGYVKGSFTGAVADKKGIFESAHGGTIFLDEIGEMPVHLQTKLLKVLQEKKIRRLGSSESISVDIRVITATNQDLEEMMKKKSFREDLYYRISTVELKTIPLRTQIRSRNEDFEYISKFILNNIATIRDKKRFIDLPIPKNSLNRLINYSWPGNVRELENVLERAYIFKDWNFSEIDSDQKTGSFNKKDEIIPLKEFERKYIVNCYNSLEKNKTKTAERLCISLNTLKKHLKEAGVK